MTLTVPRGAAVVALVGLGLAASCSSGPNALHFAKEACRFGDPSANPSTTSSDAASYANSRAAYERAAALAAKAARLDSRWDALETAESGEADVFTAGTDAENRYFANAPSVGDQQLLQSLDVKAQGFEFTIRAECRKAGS